MYVLKIWEEYANNAGRNQQIEYFENKSELEHKLWRSIRNLTHHNFHENKNGRGGPHLAEKDAEANLIVRLIDDNEYVSEIYYRIEDENGNKIVNGKEIDLGWFIEEYDLSLEYSPEFDYIRN